MIVAANKREQVFPLPVVLISTKGEDGVNNIAPWSCISPVLRPLEEVMLASYLKRDTLDNIRHSGEFVLSIPPVDMVEKVMVCAKRFPPEVDEFERAGLKPRPSSTVKPPGAAGCLAWAECRLVEEIQREKYSLIIGKVVHLELEDNFFSGNGDMDFEQAKPLTVVIGEKGAWFTRPTYIGKYFEHREMKA